MGLAVTGELSGCSFAGGSFQSRGRERGKQLYLQLAPGRRKHGRRCLFATWTLLLLGFLLPSPAVAHKLPMHPAYPDAGYTWMARNFDGGTAIWLKSERCESGEADAIARIRDTTSGSRPEFRGAWPSGISMYRITTCDGFVDNSVDILLDYMTDAEWDAQHGSVFGGHVHSSLAPASWCDFYGNTKINNKCGYHPSRIHIRTSRYLSYSATTKRNFLIHETSHSLGFKDSCSIDAITNNTGGSGCSLPDGWIALDRQEMRDHIYPAWRYS